MRDADETMADPVAAPVPVDEGSSRNPLSVAILAAVAFMPIVVAAGFLTDRPAGPRVPGDISVLALRGALDAAAEKRSAPPLPRAAY